MDDQPAPQPPDDQRTVSRHRDGDLHGGPRPVGDAGEPDARRDPGDALDAPDAPDREAPAGGPYEWVHRAQALLDSGDAAPAVVLLERARRAEPGSATVLEALARAQFETGRRSEAAETFARLTAIAPDDDYAHFGLGMSLARLGDHAAAAEHLALAAAMRPDRRDYVDQLAQVRATLRARRS